MAFKHTVPAAGTMAIAARAIALGGAAIGIALAWPLTLPGDASSQRRGL